MAAKKSLGQHWLSDQASIDSIIDFADLDPHDTVLEIGPGRGDLTKRLIEEVEAVIAVEVDQELIDELMQSIPDGQLYLVHQDIRTFDLTRMPSHYKVVGNIPYYITSMLIKLLLESAHKPTTITLLVQKEVAQRICAGPGELSMLAVSVQLYSDASLGPIIEAEKFDPVPKVDSQVVHLKLLDSPRIDVDPKKFFRLTKAGFASRRKMIKSSLSGGLNISKEEAEKLIEKAGIDPKLRAQSLSLGDWEKLYNELYN